MATVETNIDDTNDIPIRDNIVEHSNCDDYEELNRSWNTSDELDSSQDNILSKTDDFVTLPTATDSHSNGNSNSRSNSTLPSSILPDDIKIRLAVQSSLAVAATQPGAYHHDGDDGRGVGDGGTSAAGTLRNSESLLRPKPSQFELSRTIRRAYEAQLDARRHDDHGTRPSPPPDLDPLDAFPAPVVVCGHERMVDFQQGVAVEEEENRRQQRKRKRQTIGTIVASVVFMVVIAGAVFGITFGITRSSHQNATTSNGPGSDRDSGISSASFRANECYNDTLLGKGNATWERHSNFRLQMISQYPNITSLIDVPYSKENIALCWLSFFDQFHHVSEDKDELDLELAQRFALAILYFQFQSTPLNDLLGDDNAFVLGKWLSNLPACDWSYVECSDSIPKIITGLNIGAMDLAGRIPSELAMITTLKSLRCDENAFTGEIPSEMWTLTHLELLFLGNNYFNGTISNQLGNLQQLTVLSLANQLSGSVPDLRSLSKLTYLALSSPFLIGPFPKIEGLTSLESLSLDTPQLAGTIPSYFWSMTNLQMFQVQMQASLSSEIGQLTNLGALILQGSFGGTLPTEIGNLSNLRNLYVSVSQVSGFVPSELGKLSLLEEILFEGNPFMESAMPSEICSLVDSGGLLLLGADNSCGFE